MSTATTAPQHPQHAEASAPADRSGLGVILGLVGGVIAAGMVLQGFADSVMASPDLEGVGRTVVDRLFAVLGAGLDRTGALNRLAAWLLRRHLNVLLLGEERAAALDRTKAQIERTFGKGSLMTMDENALASIPGISTGAVSLDLALGGKGLPVGRVIEIYGPESSGKTTLALHAVANAQRNGGIAAFIDAEHALDPVYARQLGVDTDALLVSQPDTGEQALEIMDMLVSSGTLDIVVIDSVAALTPRAEIEGEMGDSHVGLQARLMSQALRKVTGRLHQTKTTAIFINQLREKIGVFFGSPETTTGGKALKFYASVRIDVRRIETLKEAGNPVGNRTRVKIVKNKMAPPFKQAEFDILYGVGISREGGLIDMGVEEGIVKKSGAWFTYDGDQLGQGKENARRFLRDNPDLANEIEERILTKLGIGVAPEAEDDEAPALTAVPGDTAAG